MFLLDTNVVSELRKLPLGRADPAVMTWNERHGTMPSFISAITVLEIELGILQKQQRGDPVQAETFRRWLESAVLPAFAGRILPIDAAIARRAATFHVPDPAPERDALIAATAFVHGLTVVSRNAADFERTGVSLLNPWDPVPAPEPQSR